MTASPPFDPPLVSTIMPAYNHAGYVEQAILSVAAQTYPNIELVIIDDGSTDATREAIAATLGKIERDFPVQFLTQPNAGICATLNRGLAIAKGSFVQFLASDDAYLSEKTTACMDLILAQTEDVAAVYCDGWATNMSLKPLRAFSDIYPVPLSRNIYREILISNWMPAMGLLYRRSAIDNVGGFDETLRFEDWDLLIRIARYSKILRLDERHFYYRIHESNLHARSEIMEETISEISMKYPEMNNFRNFLSAVKRISLPEISKHYSTRNFEMLLRYAVRLAQIKVRDFSKMPIN